MYVKRSDEVMSQRFIHRFAKYKSGTGGGAYLYQPIGSRSVIGTSYSVSLLKNCCH